MDLSTVIDCMGSNLETISPPGGVFMAGYATGSAGVPWTDAQFAAHPNAVRIDQWPVHTAAGATADWIDVENNAVPIIDVAARLQLAQAAYRDGTRPGQRWPAVYVEQSEITPVVNALIADGIHEGVPLILTEPMPEHAATDMLQSASGPFPIVGVQYQFHDLFDVSLVSTEWLDNVSKAPVTTQPKQGTQTGWRFCHKCQGLFWGPGQAQSVCPRGSQHDGTGSHEYTLEFAQ